MSKAWYDLGHMHRLNHSNDQAIAAFRTFFELTKEKDPAAAEEAAAQIESLGGEAPPKAKSPASKRHPKKQRKRRRQK